MIAVAASGGFGSGSEGHLRVDRPPDPLRGQRHVDVTVAERLERAHDGVDERRRRAAISNLFSFSGSSQFGAARRKTRAPNKPVW